MERSLIPTISTLILDSSAISGDLTFPAIDAKFQDPFSASSPYVVEIFLHNHNLLVASSTHTFIINDCHPHTAMAFLGSVFSRDCQLPSARLNVVELDGKSNLIKSHHLAL